MVRLIVLLILVCCLTTTLTCCFGNRTEYVQTRLDKHPQDTVGVLRPATRQKIKVFADVGENKKTEVGTIEIGPEYILIFEQDFRKIANGAKKYNNAYINLQRIVNEKRISQDVANEILTEK